MRTITHSESVCVCVSAAFAIQRTMRMRRIIFTMACLALQYFSILSHKRTIFIKKKLLNTKCVF